MWTKGDRRPEIPDGKPWARVRYRLKEPASSRALLARSRVSPTRRTSSGLRASPDTASSGIFIFGITRGTLRPWFKS